MQQNISCICLLFGSTEGVLICFSSLLQGIRSGHFGKSFGIQSVRENNFCVHHTYFSNICSIRVLNVNFVKRFVFLVMVDWSRKAVLLLCSMCIQGVSIKTERSLVSRLQCCCRYFFCTL